MRPLVYLSMNQGIDKKKKKKNYTSGHRILQHYIDTGYNKK